MVVFGRRENGESRVYKIEKKFALSFERFNILFRRRVEWRRKDWKCRKVGISDGM